MNTKFIYSVLKLVIIFFILIFSSCDVVKNIPNGKYLVDEVSLEIDNKNIKKAELSPFIRQEPNDPKFAVGIYDWVGDSKSWFKKTIGRMGQPPVIYEDRARRQSMNEMTIEMKNKGYLNAKVESVVDTVNKRAKIKYFVTSNEPYLINDYQININDFKIDSILERRNKRNRSIVKPGDIFDMYKLEEERNNVSSSLRNRGYYTTTTDNLHYLADTTLKSNQANVSLILKDGVELKPYKINKVSIYSGFDPLYRQNYHIKDSVIVKGINIYYDSTYFLRPKVIEGNIFVHPGQLFSAAQTTRTYSYLNALNCISRTNIEYEETTLNDSAYLNCKIYLTPGNIHGIQTGLEGTNKAGDLGIAANVTYTHHNIFNGSEVWGVKLRGAYEFVSGSTSKVLSHNFYEFGIGTTLGFPKTHIPFIGKFSRNKFRISSEYGMSFDIQQRPEYTRDFFNLSWKNRWENEAKTVNQTLNLIDINYVIMPWMSDEFRDYLNEDVNSLTRYSYENVFTAGIGYNIIFTNKNTGRFTQRLHTLRLGMETSGNFLYEVFKWSKAQKSETGQYNIFGNPFAQYMKGDIDFSQTQRVSEKWSIAYHTGLGAAYPYGNSDILPFEKRYYGGGPNSVRGWNTRHLGPGSYNGDEGNPTTHVGDLKLELSMEYRYKLIKWLELAFFADAGNIWTLREYENQPGGMFSFSNFYKELAVGTGIGIRLDLSFLIIRIDGGKKVYDPALPEKNRWVLFDKFGGNSAAYLAIGYPF